MKTICVLMSTYNGEKYIKEQIQSIQKNESEDWEILFVIRDDCSKDATIDLVESMIPASHLHTIKGVNLGPCKSFLELIKEAPEADVYFLCDQDDVWEVDKIKHFVDLFDDSIPQVIFSDYYLVDDKLKVIQRQSYGAMEMSLQRFMMANPVPGCTMAFNKALINILREHIPTCDVPMHDVYILAMAQVCGEVKTIDIPLVYYRQHGNNTVGVQQKKLNIKRLIQKQKKMFAQKGTPKMSQLAEHLLEYYSGYLTAKDKKFLETVKGYHTCFSKKMALLLEKRVYRKNFRSDILKIERILFNKI